jgi:ribonuclease HI
MTITVSTDGSALGNPNGPMGWAWADHATNAARTEGHQHDGDSDAGGATNGTNQIGELCAVLEALRAHRGPEPLTIETDSQYAINCSTTWVKGWKKNGWKNSQKKPVKNAPLIKAIDAELTSRPGPVKFVWIKGHNGNPGNEKVDDLAHTYSGDARSGVKDGYLPLEGWQSLLASSYARGVDIPSDARMLLDGKITEEQYHIARGVNSGSTGEADADGRDGSTASLIQRLNEPEAVPEYHFGDETVDSGPDMSDRADDAAEMPGMFDDDDAADNNMDEAVAESADRQPPAHQMANERDLGHGDFAPDTDRTPNTDQADATDTAGAEAFVKACTDEMTSERDESDANDSNTPDKPEDSAVQGVSDAANEPDATADSTKVEKPKTKQPKYLNNGLTVSGMLRFTPAPNTSPTFDGGPRHIRGVICVEGDVAPDGGIMLNGAEFLVANAGQN